MTLRGQRLTKGHGTGNDFLILSDPDAEIEVSAEEVAAVCSRHHGVGADGVIRVVRTAALAASESVAARLVADHPEAQWFMDYRNADGSLAEMCGNGVRVFVRYLIAEGLVTLEEGEILPVGTRAGVKWVTRDGEEFAVAMGLWSAPGGEEALRLGADCAVEVDGIEGARPGLSIAMPNPHVVLAVASEDEVAAANLLRAPRVQPVPTDGTNVEIVHPMGELETPDGVVGVLRMRVHERGSGETQSCGTGACAAAIAARAWMGEGAPDRWIVHVPGGTVRVRIWPDAQVELAGPAVLVADVTLR